jgi:uncharacterized protein YutE (UPF0331/DUF86 family)
MGGPDTKTRNKGGDNHPSEASFLYTVRRALEQQKQRSASDNPHQRGEDYQALIMLMDNAFDNSEHLIPLSD